jgi:hypothetical protein
MRKMMNHATPSDARFSAEIDQLQEKSGSGWADVVRVVPTVSFYAFHQRLRGDPRRRRYIQQQSLV